MRLDLADPLPSQAELVADLLERPRPAVVEAEPQTDDALLAALEAVEDALDLLAQHRVGDRVERRDRVGILDQLAELRVALVTDRRLERDGQPAVGPDLLDPLRRDRRLGIEGQDLRDLGVRRLATERHRPLADDPLPA